MDGDTCMMPLVDVRIVDNSVGVCRAIFVGSSLFECYAVRHEESAFSSTVFATARRRLDGCRVFHHVSFMLIHELHAANDLGLCK